MNEKRLERILHNFYTQHTGGNYAYSDILTIKNVINHIFDLEKVKPRKFNLNKYKVGLMFVCVNPSYWEYAKLVIDGAKQYFLPDHDVEIMLWSDIPKPTEDELFTKAGELLVQQEIARIGGVNSEAQYKQVIDYVNVVLNRALDSSKVCESIKVFKTEPIEWPYPTLMRYNLFLQEEEYLKQFDYIFYCDLDMMFVNIVGDEILGDGLTAAQHPMYALRREYWLPVEPNPESTAYIKMPGKIVTEANGNKYFHPLYYAGGFQGGKTEDFIKAMKVMKKNIDDDFVKNYIARWNDESHWNKYLSENNPAIVLSPSYIYPDSLINEYYTKIWGRNYPPKIITITKKFTINQQGGSELRDKLETM